MNLFPNIYFICVHKGASTFVSGNLLPSVARRCKDYSVYQVGHEYVEWFLKNRDALNLKPTHDATEVCRRLKIMFSEHPIPSTGCLLARLYPNHVPAICEHLNVEFPFSGSRVFVMRRDPRDALVSMYYSKAFSHNEKAILVSSRSDLAQANRNRYQEMGIYNWLESVLANLANGEILDEFKFCARILADHREVVDLPYEQLINDPQEWLTTLVKHAGFDRIVGEAWYSEMKKHLVAPETEDIYQHKRRVTPGGWKEVFDDHLSDLLKKRVGEQMEQLQYGWD